MAVGAPPVVEAWGRKAVTARRGGAPSIRCSSSVGPVGGTAGGLAEEHYRTLRLRPGATKGEVKKAFRRLTLMYHPDVCKQRGDSDCCDVDFQRINVAYQMLMSNMREAEERLEYWRLKYGLSDEDLDRARSSAGGGRGAAQEAQRITVARFSGSDGSTAAQERRPEAARQLRAAALPGGGSGQDGLPERGLDLPRV